MSRERVIRAGRWALVLMAGASLAACASLTTPKYSINTTRGLTAPPPGAPGAHGTNAPYQVAGIWYVPHDQPNYNETGIASWYGDAFQMKATANGETFDMNGISAAHTTLPLPCLVEVTNLDNGRKLTVRVNDRGPFVDGRIIDLSHAAARELGYDRAGTAHVRVRYIGPAPLNGPGAVRYAQAGPVAGAVIPVSTSGRRPADEDIFDEAGTPLPPPLPGALPGAPAIARPEPVSVTALAPLPPARTSRDALTPEAAPPRPTRDVFISDAAARRHGLADPVPTVVAQNDRAPLDRVPLDHISGYRIQAGAFSDEGNARRAVAQLAAAGVATIEPVERDGATFYRVVLPGSADEAQAQAMRDKVAAIGFADARVLRP
ncbi:MAG TPA: septal ring lytic transglycosylase RlpA family protein [Phenylobacterium sp.]|jgi:rare lipoprotein A|nr:septal ring lytic transglycosylase RlpA family protein [Phenylobacterium sp.]